jgi:pimeloyl-ACP methyl ester carboxylesterase/DNA-binding CsgD family transcriptional regulator
MDAPPVQYVRTSDGYDIAYAVVGEGIPVVRVPQMWSHFSLQWSSGMLSREFSALAERYRLILYDSRGQGSSTRGLPESTSLADYERDLDAVVEHLRLERFILLGMSAKGKVAVSYAVKHPERVIALVLWSYGSMFQTPRKPLNEVAVSDWPFFVQTAVRVGWPEQDPSLALAVHLQSNDQGDYLRQYAALSAESGDDRLAKLTVPTLVLATRTSARPLGGEEEARRIAPLIANAQLVLFDDVSGGWAAPDSQEPPVMLAIQRFLDSLPHSANTLHAASKSGLTEREEEVLRLVAAGKSNQEIANELVISRNTVRRHVSHVFDKTGVANRAQATAYAKDHGIA